MKSSNSVFNALVFAVLIFFSCTGCNKHETQRINTGKAKNTFTILTLDSIRLSGFLKRIIPEFEQAHKCKIDFVSATDKSELMELIRNDKELRKYDLVIGLDNCFLVQEEDLQLFSKSDALRKHPVNKQYVFDSEQRLIPFGFGYLCILYNEEKVIQPPESFGELQDDKYLNQLFISDPHSSGIGRATMLWTIALFGNNGFQQFWQSIKKNIHGSKDTYRDVMQTMETGESDMTFGFTSTPAWLTETISEPLPIKTSLMKEGSFLYIEAAAIPAKAGNKALADKFLNYLLSPEVQKYVAYDLGIFPANESAPLPEKFLSSPYSTTYVNNKLRYENPEANISIWLEIWDKLFSRSIM